MKEDGGLVIRRVVGSYKGVMYMGLTYCSFVDCQDTECAYHQDNAPKDKMISISDRNEGCLVKCPPDKKFSVQRK